jgi:hypothetical protein
VSRYLILIILNAPLVCVGILSAVVSFKMGHITKGRLAFRLFLWVGILLGLIFAEPIYNYLFSNKLTETEPLSLFDVIQITGIVLTLFIANRAYIKAETMERRVQDLHQELSIRLSQE